MDLLCRDDDLVCRRPTRCQLDVAQQAAQHEDQRHRPALRKKYCAGRTVARQWLGVLFARQARREQTDRQELLKDEESSLSLSRNLFTFSHFRIFAFSQITFSHFSRFHIFAFLHLVRAANVNPATTPRTEAATPGGDERCVAVARRCANLLCRTRFLSAVVCVLHGHPAA